MTPERGLVHALRNTPVREIEAALFRDGFILRRDSHKGPRFYKHPDGRRTNLHYHHSSDTLTRKTLGSVLAATRWTEDDARRLGLL